MATFNARICIRRGLASEFTSANPTLALGEIAYETDTRNIKVGDGATAWTALGYINPYRGGTAAAPTSNTVLGSAAGGSLNASATLNSAFGFGALSNLTSGTASTAIGYAALNVASGSNNTAVGTGAGQSVTSGAGNTFVGRSAGLLSTASDITAVGANALDANTTGTNNTAVGKDSLGANTTGGSNVAVGHSASLSNTTGVNNVSLGEASLYYATTGAGNVAVGRYALYSTAAGANLSAIGLNSLFNIGAGGATSSAGTIGIGANAGRWRGSGTDTLTVADTSIFIGTGARAAGDSQSNQIVIAGNDGIGNGSNTTTIGNSSTTETYLAGNVTVNGDDIYGGTVISSRDTNRITFGGSAPTMRLMDPAAYTVGMGITSNSPHIGTFNVSGLAIRTNNTDRMTFAPNGADVTVTSGNMIFASGKGIDFSATANSSGTMTSELLSDYEEGTWTPVYSPTTGSFTTLTMDVIGAKYVKVGSQVTVTAMLRTDNVDATGASGALRIEGLPFSTSSVGRGAGSLSGGGNWAGDTPMSLLVLESRTFLDLYYRDASDTQDLSVVVADMTTGATANQNSIYITCTYMT